MTARKLLALPLAFVGGIILPLFSGCVESDPDHCVNKGGDEFCGEGKYCTNNCGGDYDDQGCLAANAPPPEGCWLCNGSGDNSNCGSIGDGDGDATMTDTTADTSTTDATDTMGTTAETTSGPECMMSSECAAAEEPLCDAEACVGCGDAVTASCAADYPATPVCDAASGACVQCSEADMSACEGDTPVCEGGVCVPCSEHDQCMESACNMSTGACMDPDRVWWVNQSVAGPGTGAAADPYKEFTTALANVGPGEEGTIYFATPGNHTGQVQVLGNRTVAIIGKTQLGFVQFFGAAAVDLNQNSTVFMHSMKVSGGDDVGLRCSGCNLWLTKSEIVKNSDGDISVLSGDVKVVDSFIGGNLANFPAMSVSSGSVEVIFSTIAGGAISSAAITCVDGSGVIIRNSLIVSAQVASEVVCAGAQISSSALEMALPGNTSLGMMPDLSWFENYVEGDFHIAPAAPPAINGAAIWQLTDPSTDIDGDPRPTMDGAPDYAGADVPN